MLASLHEIGTETVRRSPLLSQFLCATNCDKLSERGLSPSLLHDLPRESDLQSLGQCREGAPAELERLSASLCAGEQRSVPKRGAGVPPTPLVGRQSLEPSSLERSALDALERGLEPPPHEWADARRPGAAALRERRQDLDPRPRVAVAAGRDEARVGRVEWTDEEEPEPGRVGEVRARTVEARRERSAASVDTGRVERRRADRADQGERGLIGE